MDISARPSARWFRFAARVTGVPTDEQCRLVVVARDGAQYTAGAWTVAGDSSLIDGITLLAPWQVYAVELRDASGDLLARQRMI
jgi:RNA polymerase sigma-70 factor (ECF subfamily)